MKMHMTDPIAPPQPDPTPGRPPPEIPPDGPPPEIDDPVVPFQDPPQPPLDPGDPRPYDEPLRQ